MEQLEFDVIIIGTGLGAAAIAHRIAGTGAHVVMTPGVGCARFKHLDGGVVSARSLEASFGTSDGAPLHGDGAQSSFRRDLLEAWAINRLGERVTVVDRFDDLRVEPHDGGGHALYEESGERVLIGKMLILTEGASPKIGIAAGIRPDFEPEDLLHFGRVILPGVHIDGPESGIWRTSWNMPAWFTAIPHPDGVIIGASARIENIMRVGRDGRDVVRDFLSSPLARGWGLLVQPAEVGMELVPLRRDTRVDRVAAGDIVITPDANGMIDPRWLQRYKAILAAGSRIGEVIAREWPDTPDWREHLHLWNVPTPGRTPYHDSSTTGFIEEGAGKPHGILRKLLKR